MADTKITALTALTAADPANDVIPIVDVSDTSMAASGTTKKITTNQILGAGGTATLASATITGDLTVDTSTLKVDSTNNRVGIGTATPTAGIKLDIVSTTSDNFVRFSDSVNATGYLGVQASNGTVYLHGNNNIVSLSCSTSNTTATEQLRITNPGVFEFLDGVSGTRMTLNSTGLGIGLSPTYKLQSVGIAAATSVSVNGSGGNLIGAMLNSDDANSGVNPGVDLRRWTGTALNHGLTYIATNATGDTLFYNGTAASNTRATSLKMTLDASGNLLVGTTATNASLLTGFVAKYNSGESQFFIGHPTATVTGTYYEGYSYNGSLIGSITQNGTTGVLYNTSSDYRLKESVKPISGGLARVNALKPSVYNWKSDGLTGEGFLAHELAEVVPFAVSGEKDAVNADGTIKSQGIDMSRIVPILVAAIQELTAEVNALKNA